VDEPQDEPVNPHIVPREHRLHGKRIAFGDPFEQPFIINALLRAEARLFAQCIGKDNRAFFARALDLPRHAIRP
jgi:hypothetical protein